MVQFDPCNYVQLIRCSDGEATNQYVDKSYKGRVLKIGGECYTAGTALKAVTNAGQVQVSSGESFESCATCDPGCVEASGSGGQPEGPWSGVVSATGSFEIEYPGTYDVDLTVHVDGKHGDLTVTFNGASVSVAGQTLANSILSFEECCRSCCEWYVHKSTEVTGQVTLSPGTYQVAVSGQADLEEWGEGIQLSFTGSICSEGEGI